jgi:hypothetical protein
MAGRKPKYATDELINHLQDYNKKHPHKLIKYSHLEKEYDIKSYIWRDNQKVSSLIKKINNTPIVSVSAEKIIVFPSAEQLVESNRGSESRLIKAIQHFLDLCSDNYDDVMMAKTFKAKEQSYIKRLEEKDAQIRKLKSEIKSLNKEIDMLYISSRSQKNRNELGLKDNLIEFDKISKKLSTDITEMKKSINGLFDSTN